MKICIFGNRHNTLSLIKFISNSYPKSSIGLVTLNSDNKSVDTISGFADTLQVDAAPYIKDLHVVDDYKLRDETFIKEVSAKNYDVGLSIGWQRIIPSKVLDEFTHGIYGWHGSCFRLPNGRGRSPLNWSIRLGANLMFLNLFKYSPGVDDGEIYGTYTIAISDKDYISDLQAKVLDISLVSAKQLLDDLLHKKISLREQVDHPFILFPKLTEASGELFPTDMNVLDAHRIIRSCSRPFPGAFLREESLGKIRIWTSEFTIGNTTPSQKVELAGTTLLIRFIDGVIASEDYEILK